MTVDFVARQAKLSALADAVALVPGTSMQYFTGLDFHLSERPIVAIFMGERLGLHLPRAGSAEIARWPRRAGGGNLPLDG